MNLTYITNSFFSGFSNSVISIVDEVALSVNYTVFDQCYANSAPAISFNSKHFIAAGLCIYRCQSKTGSSSLQIKGDTNLSYTSIAFCSPNFKPEDDVLNFNWGSTQFCKTNISYGNSNGASGFQISGVDNTKHIYVMNILCANCSGGHVIEYNKINTHSIFDNVIVKSNNCDTASFMYYIEDPKGITFKNCYFESSDKYPFMKNVDRQITCTFENTYFCGKNFGNSITLNLILTESLDIPSIVAGYNTHHCIGALHLITNQRSTQVLMMRMYLLMLSCSVVFSGDK